MNFGSTILNKQHYVYAMVKTTNHGMDVAWPSTLGNLSTSSWNYQKP
jgi:hypothetical protein